MVQICLSDPNFIYLHILFLSAVGVQAALELEDDEDNGGFAKLVGGGG